VSLLLVSSGVRAQTRLTRNGKPAARIVVAQQTAADLTAAQLLQRFGRESTAVLRTQAEAVLGKSRGIRSSDQDVALAGRHVMQQGQCRTGRFADESLQQLRGREIGS